MDTDAKAGNRKGRPNYPTDFNVLYENDAIQEAACWAHVRRELHDSHVARPSALTTEAPRRVAELYVIEAEIRGKPGDERKTVLA